MSRRRRSRTALAAALAIVVATVAAACGGDGGDDTTTGVDEVGVYAAVIRAAAPATTDGATPVVYVAPHGDSEQLPLETQVAIVERVADDVTVRFVDADGEALDHDEDDQPVLDDGVLLRIGAVPDGAAPVTVTAERIASRTDRAEVDYTVTPPVTPGDDDWTAVPAAERPLPTTVPPDG